MGERFSAAEFEHTLSAYIDYIYNLSYRLCGNKEYAEDIAQESLLTAWKKQDQLRNSKALSSWLRRICLNTFLQYERKDKRVVFVETGLESEIIQDSTPSQEDEVVVDEAVREIQDGCFTAMATRLSHGQRTVFVLVDMLGLTFAEAAELLDTSISAVKSLLHRARNSLNAFFGHHCQWVLPENTCTCKAWAQFAAHREKLREQVRKHGGSPDFGSPEYGARSDPATMGRVLSLFKQMPYKKPSAAWYADIVKKIAQSMKKND